MIWWLIKTDAGGNEEWSATYGGVYSDVGYEVHQTADGGYIVVGHTLSYGAGMHDVYLIRLAPPARPLFTVSPDSLWFGSLVVGDTLLDSVRVQNQGNADLIIDSVASTNPFFTVSPVSGIILPDSSTHFYIQLIGAVPGPQEGFIIFHHNGATSTDSVLVKADVITGFVPLEEITIDDYVLFQNYPNPFNASTNIKIRIAEKGYITLRIFNILGDEVAVLVADWLDAGSYHFEFHASHLPSGVYFYRLTAGSERGASDNFEMTRKLVLLR